MQSTQFHSEKPSFGQFQNKNDSNDLFALISTQFSKYQNFRKVFIIKIDFIFLGDIFADWKKGLLLHTLRRRDGRVVDCGGLENRCTVRYRGFESLSLRRYGCSSVGRALVSKTRCRAFESLLPCHFPPRTFFNFCFLYCQL